MRNAMNKKNKLSGFTLIELMITVAILGILSSIAVPSYMTYVTKSKRTEAKTEVLRIAQLQESHYIQNLSYAPALNNGLSFPSVWMQTETGLYNVRTQGTPTNCQGTSASPCTGYFVHASPVNGKGQDKDKKCTVFRLYNTGLKQAVGSAGAGWNNADNLKECWG